MRQSARRVARWAAFGIVCALVAVLVAIHGGPPAYEVRAIFDDAGNVVAGEDVRIAGVDVGSVASVSLTPDRHHAAVELHITNPAFHDFRTNATCAIRPQSLVGEMFVDCAPTRPHVAGIPAPPPLPVVPSGSPGAGQRLLPVAQTSSPVSLDLIGDIARLPYAQRLTIVVNELGVGLAGNGQALEEVVQRADPALGSLDRVLTILASEDSVLSRLAGEANVVVRGLAPARRQFADAIASAAPVVGVAAAHRAALGQALVRLPTFLASLTPTLRALSTLSVRANPALANLAIASPAINGAVTHLAPFASGGTALVTGLGPTAQQGSEALTASTPLLRQLSSLGAAATPLASNAATLLQSVRRRGGLSDLLHLIFRTSLATNGYDSYGHFLRAFLRITGSCINYNLTPVNTDCTANLHGTGAATASAVASVVSAAVRHAADPSASNELLNYLLGR